MLYDGFEAIIGLECHVQLRTRTKMFCPCPVVPDGSPPNTAICPICMAHPGTLPALNARAIHLALRAASAFGCTIHRRSVFARKSYFYPDLPKGYQITQYDLPIATGGLLHTPLGAFGLTRIHLEEDAGKQHHQEGYSEVDWNRAGTPLIEIVSEPEMRTPEQAEAYMRGLHRVLVAGGISEGSLERGQLRCDVNVSLHRPGEPWGVRVEVKNINSFRFAARAIRSEIVRQAELLKAGERVYQETRTWSGGGTVLLRRKEESADYRYFPEPDLPELLLSEAEVAEAAGALPGAPLDLWLAAQDAARRAEWTERYGLSAQDVGVLTGAPEAEACFVAAVAAGGEPKKMANLVMTEWLRRFNAAEGAGKCTGETLVAVQALLDGGAINRDGMKKLLDVLWEEGGAPGEHVARLGLGQVSDEGALRAAVLEVIGRFPAEAARYRAGNAGLAGFFVGEVMKATGRKADPKRCRELVLEGLS